MTPAAPSAAFAAAAALLLAAAAPAPSPFDGTWKTDMSSIKFPTRPRVMLVKDGVFTCSSCVPAYSLKADGAFHPVAGHPENDEMSVKVMDARTVEEVDRKGGRTVGTAKIVLASDGRTATVRWTDTTNPGAPKASGESVNTRVAPAPAGAHPLSGGWLAVKAQGSDTAITQTIKLEGDRLTMTTPTGQSYVARIDGPAAPFKGDPTVTTVSVKRTGPLELVETDFYDGKPISEMRMTAAPDGRSILFHGKNLKTGSTSSAKVVKA